MIYTAAGMQLPLLFSTYCQFVTFVKVFLRSSFFPISILVLNPWGNVPSTPITTETIFMFMFHKLLTFLTQVKCQSAAD